MPRSADKPLVLAADDAEELRALMAKVLSPLYRVKTVADGASALLAAAANPPPDLVLLDVEMTGMSGFEVCRALKANPATAPIPVIFLTGKAAAQDEANGFSLGAVDYVTKPINAAILLARVRTHLALANQRVALEDLVRERTARLERAQADLIDCLGRVMQSHESAAAGNRSRRLAQYARLIALAAGARPALAELLGKVAPLHDIGKISVPAEVLRRAGPLSAPDWERVRRHPQYGAAILGEHEEPHLKLARIVALTHHENWDGTGYPKGLAGEAIPWPGRVVALADAFEAMTTTQFYREPLGVEKAVAEIERGAGSRFDPAVVTAFRKALPGLRKVRAAFEDTLGDIVNLDFAAPSRAAKRSGAR